MQKIFLFAAMSAVTLTAGSAMAFDIVIDGAPRVAISSGKTDPEIFAVREIFRIVKSISGAEVATNAATSTVPNRIVIGSPKTNPEIAKAIEADTFSLAGKNDKIVVKTDGTTLFCAGNTPRAAMCAAFEMLEHLGCRWFWPGESGEFLPRESKDIILSETDFSSEAAFFNRQLAAHPDVDKLLFFAHNKMNPRGGKYQHYSFGFTETWGGHSFNWIFPKDCKTIAEYFDKYPEQFALNNGIRMINQHCYTNPDTIRTFVEWIDDFWDTHPEVELLNLSARDSPIYCKCSECSKTDSSTLFFNFINTIVAGVEKEHPDKKYATIAYSFYLDAPKTKLRDNVSLTYCMYNRCYKHRFDDPKCPVNQRAIDAMHSWKRAGVKPDIYGYHFDAFGSREPFLTPFAPVVADELRWARDFGCNYWMTEYHSKLPCAKGKITALDSNALVNRYSAYATARLLWDPDLKTDDILHDFCDRVFGAASTELFKYYRLMEEAWQGSGHISYYNSNAATQADNIVTEELIAKADALFATALKKVTGDPRTTADVEFEKAVWERWRDLKLSRDNWVALANKRDEDRIDFLRTAKPSKDLVAPDPNKPLFPFTSDTCSIATDAEDNTLYISYKPARNANGNFANDGLLFGNHPRFMSDHCNQVNYEYSFDFRAPEENFNSFTASLRCGRANMRVAVTSSDGKIAPDNNFEAISIELSRKSVKASRLFRHGTRSPELLGKADFTNSLDNGWHTFSARAIDTVLIVSIDGKPVLECDAPLGGGVVNLRCYQPLDVRAVHVRAVPSPSIAELWNTGIPFSESAPNMDGTGTDKAWGNGKTIRSFKNTGSYQPDSAATLLRTDKALYLRFFGYGDRKIVADCKVNDDGTTYRDDGVELYLDPNNTRTDFYWIVVNSKGIATDAQASIGLNINRKWNGQWRRATSVRDDNTWVIEFEFPYSTFGEFKPGVPWLLGLNRCGSGVRQSWTDATYQNPASFRTIYAAE